MLLVLCAKRNAMPESNSGSSGRVEKSSGLTRSERFLASLCERSFLALWSYPNAYQDDGHELCDLLAVFEDRVFIFFDREKSLSAHTDADLEVEWDRWKRRVIDAQIKTAEGAERYIRSGRPIFLDPARTTPLPIRINTSSAVVHKIIVAHGAKEACLRASPENVAGSLGVCYGNAEAVSRVPFLIELDKDRPVHVLDSHNLPILLSELDTVADFSFYLDAKLEAISSLDFLIYCGEEDLLANYFTSFDETLKRHFIGTTDASFNGVMIEEGEWNAFTKLEVYRQTKRANKVSFLWDRLVQKTAQNALVFCKRPQR